MSDLIQWTLAFKYWKVTRRLEMAISGQNTRRFKKLWRIIYVTTAAFNIISAILDVISTVQHVHSNRNEAIFIATLLGQLPLAVTCYFLLDGFKRLREL